MIGLIFGIIILAFVSVVLVRTINFKPQEKETREVENIDFDYESAISNLQKLVKCKTISYFDHSLEDDKEFNKLVRMLPKLYPNVCKNLKLKKFDGRALLFYWKGKKKGDPAVFMAHYDVVPVEQENWTKPAFDALIEDNIMWGRGTLDTKVTFNGVLSAGEHLLKKGFKPEHDVYFAFSGGEETNGPGAKNIVNYLDDFFKLFDEYGVTNYSGKPIAGTVIKNIIRNPKYKGYYHANISETIDYRTKKRK